MIKITSTPEALEKIAKWEKESTTLTETKIQSLLVKWARLNEVQYKALRNLFAIPNGTHKRSFKSRQKHANEGLKSGVPDLFLAYPSGKYHGYFIEFKVKGKKPEPNQLFWADLLTDSGYKWEWFDDWELARESILEYLNE